MTRDSTALPRRRFLIGGAGAVLGASMARGASMRQGPVWVSSTQGERWKTMSAPVVMRDAGAADVTIDPHARLQTIEGFGACFNELGWMALQALSADQREGVLRELFAPGVGAGLTLCRTPIGANDFSRGWYSYDETPQDFGMSGFSIANDRETLLPFIKGAQRYQPKLKLWASPWSPPSWMKANGKYSAAGDSKEGSDLFIQDDRHLDAYADYFARYVAAYQAEGVPIGMVMPQNEFNSAQIFPSCTWSPEGLARFIRHLAPRMDAMGVDVFLGTIERGNPQIVETILQSPGVASCLKGAGFQWAGKSAIDTIRKSHPGLRLYQTEQECGDGRNTWDFARYAWTLMHRYIASGASAYMYWNIALPPGGASHWGWHQNALLTVDPQSAEPVWNPDYLALKHVSHFVPPGSQLLATSGADQKLLAFRTPDHRIVVVVHNDKPVSTRMLLKIGGRGCALDLPADSFNSIVV